MRAPLEARFWAKVNIRAADECWEWQAAKDGHGYGAIADSPRRGTLQAHRVAYELSHGEIPPGLHVLHCCDNPACVNPAHLRVGTHKENMGDMIARGRGFIPLPRRGRGRNLKLTPHDVRQIRAAPDRALDIARRFGVTPTTVRQIRRGATWAHVE